MMNKLVAASILGIAFMSLSAVAQSKPSKFMGQGLFEQTGSNSCLYCHGLGGHNGKIAIAANLTKPKTWKSYKGLGGDAALAKNRDEFLGRLQQAVEHLIKNGAVIHNSGFKEAWYDSGKAGGAVNSQMLGLGGSPSQAWLKKYANRGVTKDIASKAAYLYIETLDTEGVFAK